jgi:HEAT repeat protein
MGHKKAQKAQKFSICAFCAFLWLSCLPALGQDAIQQQQQRLNSGDVEERRDAVMRLGAMRREAASRAVLPALHDAAPIVRATAAKAILSLGSDASAGYLLPLLNDKDEFVRRETAYALGHTRSRTATSALSERLLTDKEDGVKAAAAIALGEIADEAAVVPLVQTLSSTKKPNAFVLRAAAVALGKIKSRAGTAALIATLNNEKLPSDVRREAARSLGLIGDPAAAPALQAASINADPYLAEIAQTALKSLSH